MNPPTKHESPCHGTDLRPGIRCPDCGAVGAFAPTKLTRLTEEQVADLAVSSLERIATLRKVLEDLVDRCDRSALADGSSIDTLAAHIALGHLHCDVCGGRLRSGDCVTGDCPRYNPDADG